MPPRKSKTPTAASSYRNKPKKIAPIPGTSKSKKQGRKSKTPTVKVTSRKKRSVSPSRNPSTAQKKKRGTQEPRVTKKTEKRKVQREDDFLDKRVSARALLKWKPIQKSTQDLVSNIVNQAILSSLNQTSAMSYGNVQEHLDNLKTRITATLKKRKAPTAKYVDYKKMESHCKLLEEVLVQSSLQVELMEDQAEQLDVSVEGKQEEVAELEHAVSDFNDNQANWKKKLHPILREDYEDELNLTALPEDSFKLPISQVDEDIDVHQSRLLHRLTDLQSSHTANELAEYVETVATVASVLTRK
ncbi:centromere protein Q-like [Ptychodera flava]|uniref:centromere protein Q-like n=1 Tax=Ptychodera flava TaxID=63121 RepID=UPI00396A4C13